MENKQINEMTNEEILRRQLELLAAYSANEACVEDLPQLTLAMIELYKHLPNENYSLFCTSPDLEVDY